LSKIIKEDESEENNFNMINYPKNIQSKGEYYENMPLFMSDDYKRMYLD
jgi:hypothetical protein